MRLSYGSVFVSGGGPPALEVATIRGSHGPEAADDTIAWSCAALDAAGTWTGAPRPAACTLLRQGGGEVTWRGLMPRARARLRVGRTIHEGPGYAERLLLTIPPTRLPLERLFWGRHVSADHSVVWIEWQGRPDQTHVWLDGEVQANARRKRGGISGLAGGLRLILDPPVDLLDRPLVSVVARSSPDLARRIVGPFAAMREHKMLSRSRLMRGEETLDEGMSIHEEVGA